MDANVLNDELTIDLNFSVALHLCYLQLNKYQMQISECVSRMAFILNRYIELSKMRDKNDDFMRFIFRWYVTLLMLNRIEISDVHHIVVQLESKETSLFLDIIIDIKFKIKMIRLYTSNG